MKKGKTDYAIRLYRSFYDLVRKTPFLNYAAHKIMQSERVHHFPLYNVLYRYVVNIKAKQYLKAPPVLEIMVTDICNARCIMCPPEVNMGKTIMDQKLFERLCNEAEKLGIKKMIITGGEPLVDKKIIDKIRYAKTHGFLSVHMFTNGSLLNEKISRELIDSGLDSLTCSIDSSTKEEYEKIRVGLNFNKVVGNFQRFMKIRKNMESVRPLTRINMVCLPQNRKNRKNFRYIFAGHADIVEIIDSHNWGDNTFWTTDTKGEYTQKKRYPCHLLFSKIVIWPTGLIKKCSIACGENSSVGDIRHQALKNFINSKLVLDLKNAHLNYNFTEPGCDVCTHKESWWVDY